MNLSNRLTFSLACFVLLLAFVALPVWSHPIVTDDSDPANLVYDGTHGNDPATHLSHAIVESIEITSDYAADGYVSLDDVSFDIRITFDSTAGEPTDFDAADLATTNTWSIRNVQGSGFVYTATVVLPAAAGSDVENEVIQIASGATTNIKGAADGVAAQPIYSPPNADDDADTNPDTGPEADKANPAKAVVTLDVTAPVIDDGLDADGNPVTDPTTDIAPKAIALGNDLVPLNNKWVNPFRLTFNLRGYSADMSLDLTTLSFTADPDVLTFGTPGYTGNGDLFAVDVGYMDAAVTDGQEVEITISLSDKAGHETEVTHTVMLAARTADPAMLPASGVSPPSGDTVEPGDMVTLTFSKVPMNLTAMIGTTALTVTPGTPATTQMVEIPTNQAAGAISIVLEWDNSPSNVAPLSYTVVIPPVPPVAAPTVSPTAGANVEIEPGDMITLTFVADPGDVTAMIGSTDLTVADGTPAATQKTFMIPDNQAAGQLTITLAWDRGGSATLTYKVPEPFVSSNPTSPSNISDPIEIPANSYLILVRDMDAMYKEASFSFPQVDGADVMIEEWPGMPDLEALFNRSSFGQGGVLVLRRSADARDNRMNDADGNAINEYATPARGSVGISEIMWALDEGQLNRDRQIQSQWIELHNVNSKPVKVLIYAQQGREPGLAGDMQLIRDGFVHNTLAGDTIVHKTGGAPSGMVVDAVTNINNKGDGREGGWDPKGDDGNSVTGDALTSMHRILPHNESAYSAAQNYTKRDGRDGGVWRSASNIYARLETSQPGSATTNVVVITDYNGTPGQRNDYTGVTLHTKKPTTNLNDSPALVFNEIGNRATADRKYEWIEIRNTTGSPISLKTYIITTLTAVGTETILIRIPHNQAADVPKNGVLLLLASDPDGDPDHPLSVGYNIDEPYDDQEQGSKGDHVPRYKVVNFQGDGIPNGQFILVLRKPDDAGKNDISETGNADFDKIVDIAGHSTNLSKSIAQGGYPNPVSETSLWPLHSFPGSHSGNNMTDDRVWDRRRVNSKGNDLLGAGHWDGSSTFGAVGYTGIGYRRDVPSDRRYGGTPGYHNVRVNQVGSVTGDVVISELMLSTGSSTSRRLPQWIEITNNSLTKAINLKADDGWRLVIETPNDEIRTINFKDWDHGNYILPNQTVLIVAGSPTRNAPAGSDNLPTNIVFKDDRIFNVFREYGAGFTEIDDDFDDPRNDLTKSDRYRFLNQKQFHIELIDGKGTVADVVGNLDGNPRTNDTADWEYPDGLTLAREGRNQYRTSFIRVFDDGTARTAVGSDAVDVLPLDPVRSGAVEAADLEFNDFGSVIPDKYAWIQAAVLNFDSIYVRHTWYGSEADFGTPGSLKGQPLPVALSFFRPTLEDGKVVIRWTTESELDNAGFNILRSDSRNGEFEQVNERLIQGNGTTAERSTYKWVDTTAKPGVVYYYQIEDVSFAGERETLTTTKLKGLISAKNKLATTWSELKSQN